jgi:hypothetical protein
MPASSEAKKPTEKTAPNRTRISSAPAPMISPSMIAAPTRDHQPARAYRPYAIGGAA